MHLSAGLFAAIVVVIMSVTGVLLTYELQLQQWEAGGKVAVPASPERMPLDALILTAGADQTGPPSTIAVSADPAQAVTVSWGREATVMVNPYTGEVLPEGPTTVRDALADLRSWHRWLGQEGESRDFGRSITGVCNMAFLFIVVSGIYLWMPRKWSMNSVKAVALFKSGLAGKARDFNWHNVIGVWSMIPLFFIVFSGAVISYPWVSDLVYTAFGEEAPVRPTPGGPGGPPRGGGGPPNAAAGREAGPRGGDRQRGGAEHEAAAPVSLDAFNFTAFLASADATAADWRTVRITLPQAAGEPVTVAVDRGSGRQPHLQSTLTLDGKTGNVLKTEVFSDQTPGARARRLLRFAHTGEVGGVFGQTLAGLVSAGAVVLAYTGIALSWRRFRAWIARRAAA
jgi:uncharacterized iron-regulated membrane protein